MGTKSAKHWWGHDRLMQRDLPQSWSPRTPGQVQSPERRACHRNLHQARFHTEPGPEWVCYILLPRIIRLSTSKMPNERLWFVRVSLKLMDQFCSLIHSMRHSAGDSGLPMGLPRCWRKLLGPNAKVCMFSAVSMRSGTSRTAIFQTSEWHWASCRRDLSQDHPDYWSSPIDGEDFIAIYVHVRSEKI